MLVLMCMYGHLWMTGHGNYVWMYGHVCMTAELGNRRVGEPGEPRKNVQTRTKEKINTQMMLNGRRDVPMSFERTLRVELCIVATRESTALLTERATIKAQCLSSEDSAWKLIDCVVQVGRTFARGSTAFVGLEAHVTVQKLGKVSTTLQVVNTVMPFLVAGRPRAQHRATIRKSA